MSREEEIVTLEAQTAIYEYVKKPSNYCTNILIHLKLFIINCREAVPKAQQKHQERSNLPKICANLLSK